MRLFSTFFLLAVLLSGVHARARPYAVIKKSGTLLIATEGAFPPFNFVKDGKVGGFEIELVDEMARRIGFKTEWQTQSFDGLLIGLQQGRFDVVAASHAITPERKNVVSFLSPHFCSSGIIVSLQHGPKSLSELKGKKIGAQVSSIYPKFAETRIPGSEVRSYPTDPDVVQALLNHKIDAALTDRFLVRQMTKAHPELQSGDPVNPEQNGIAVQKENAALVTELNAALAAIQRDGTYEKLSRKYFDEDIRCKK
jgi:polar amino acid transport system substrate-binding protein